MYCRSCVREIRNSQHILQTMTTVTTNNRRRLQTFARRAGYGVAGFAVGLPTLSVAYAGYVYGTTPKDQISTSHTPYSIWVQSLTNLFMTRLGSMSASNLDKTCANAAEVNERLLLSLVEANKNTAYGRDNRFGVVNSDADKGKKTSIQSRDDFVRRHPITNHEHYQSYIDRVSNGEPNVMFPDTPRMIAETSGTSGTRKLLPVNPLQRKVFFLEGIGTTFDALIKGVAQKTNGEIQWPNLQKSAKLMFRPRYGTSSGGLRVGPNSSSPDDNKTLLQLYTTPEDAWQVQSEEDMLFLHCLHALLDKHLGFIESNFASGVFNMFVCIDDNWSELVECIRTGKLPDRLNIGPDLRQKLEGGLKPNSDRADELDAIRMRCQLANGDRPSFARLVWPTLHTILAVETGSFAIYGKKLREEWIGDDITIYSPLYAASEGLIGVNPSIDEKTYILHPKSMFYEFIPVEENKASDGKEAVAETETLFIEQLEVGKTYEMIITNLTGLYRYRFGDVVRCVGYRGEAPIIEFAYRKGQFLNALGERTSEETFYGALSETVSKDWKLRLKDYTCIEYFNRPSGKRRPKYTVYVELTNEDGSHFDRPVMTKAGIEALDRRLAKANQLYDLFRKKNRLSCIEVIPVKSGTFEQVRQAMVESGVGITQIKQPRVTRREDLIEILENSVTRL